MQNVKWLARITLLEEPFEGYQNAVGYRIYDADGNAGEPGDADAAAFADGAARSARLPDPRAPPEPGPLTLEGRAWSGHGPIERVEVSTDGGSSFAEARLGEPLGDAAWIGWQFDWDAPPGTHVVSSRATDAAGNPSRSNRPGT